MMTETPEIYIPEPGDFLGDPFRREVVSDVHVPGWRLLIEPMRPQEKSEGGIHYADETIKNKEIIQCIGLVLTVGELCYQHEKFDGKPLTKAGDWVIYSMTAGLRIPYTWRNETRTLLLLNENDIRAVINHPERVRFYDK